MHATNYDVASTPVQRPRGGGNLGPGSYNVPVTIACDPKPNILSPDEKRRKPQQGLDFQSTFQTASHWTVPKSGFVPKKGQEQESQVEKRRKAFNRKNRNIVFPGPADYENAASAMAWGKRTLPDATARGLLPRNGALPEEETEDESTPKFKPKVVFKNKQVGGNPGFRECAWFAKDGGLRFSQAEEGSLRWPAISA